MIFVTAGMPLHFGEAIKHNINTVVTGKRIKYFISCEEESFRGQRFLMQVTQGGLKKHLEQIFLLIEKELEANPKCNAVVMREIFLDNCHSKLLLTHLTDDVAKKYLGKPLELGQALAINPPISTKAELDMEREYNKHKKRVRACEAKIRLKMRKFNQKDSWDVSNVVSLKTKVKKQN